jgi:hypothetical protein
MPLLKLGESDAQLAPSGWSMILRIRCLCLPGSFKKGQLVSAPDDKVYSSRHLQPAPASPPPLSRPLTLTPLH